MRVIHLYTNNVDNFFWWLGLVLFTAALIGWLYIYYRWRFNASSSDLCLSNDKPTIISRLLDEMKGDSNRSGT